jgi:hypothetical protein
MVTLPNYMKLVLSFRLLIDFYRPIPLCAPGFHMQISLLAPGVCQFHGANMNKWHQ